MIIYYIYEIPGVKVGCTKDLKHRVEQKQKTPLGQYNILGAANNIQDATEMEQEWQIKLGYSVDKINYNEVLKWQAKCNTPEAQAKRVANTDYKAIMEKRNFDYKTKVVNTDYKKQAEKRMKPVLQYDKQGNFIKEWPSAKDAAAALKLHKGNITSCCKNKIKLCGGFIWKYKN